jgi:hypothetical protein
MVTRRVFHTGRCAFCRSEFTRTHRQLNDGRLPACCSKSCAQRLRGLLGKSCPVVERSCVECSTVVIARPNAQLDRRWVCTACRPIVTKRERHEAYKLSYGAKPWYTKKPRTARPCVVCARSFTALNARVCQVCSKDRKYELTLDELGARDGWRCHICTRSVTREQASADHLVPFSDGGDGSALNIRLAHRVCNSRRGSGRLPAQLLLVG